MKQLESSDRQRRERAESENAGSLVRALEEMERQQSGVLSAALERSDAALGEVARVKEVKSGRKSGRAIRRDFLYPFYVQYCRFRKRYSTSWKARY